MRRTLKLMFFAIEVNLVLWLAIAGMALSSSESGTPSSSAVVDLRWMAFIGVAFAAVVQHWAYYALYRRARNLDRPAAGTT